MFWKFYEIKSSFGISCAIERAPESKLSVHEFWELLEDNDVKLFIKKKFDTPFWIRFTLPLFILVFILLFLFMPIKYMLVGKWGYHWEWIRRWSQALGL